MKLVAIYLAFWISLIVSGGMMFAGGIISEMSLAIVGFTSATLVFVGLIGLLPWAVDNYYSRHSELKRDVLPRTRIFPPAASQLAGGSEKPAKKRIEIQNSSVIGPRLPVDA